MSTNNICSYKENQKSIAYASLNTALKIILTPFWKRVYSKTKQHLPFGRKFFPFRVDSFSEGVQEGKLKVKKVFFLV